MWLDEGLCNNNSSGLNVRFEPLRIHREITGKQLEVNFLNLTSATLLPFPNPDGRKTPMERNARARASRFRASKSNEFEDERKMKIIT